MTCSRGTGTGTRTGPNTGAGTIERGRTAATTMPAEWPTSSQPMFGAARDGERHDLVDDPEKRSEA